MSERIERIEKIEKIEKIDQTSNDAKNESEDQKSNADKTQELGHLRDEIDKIDAQVATLLVNRFELVQEIGRRKSAHHIPVLDSDREKNIIQKVRAKAKDEDCANFIQKIFEQIFKGSRDKQAETVTEVSMTPSK